MGNSCCIAKHKQDLNELSPEVLKQRKDKRYSIKTNNYAENIIKNTSSKPKQNTKSEIKEIKQTKALQSGKLTDNPGNREKQKLKQGLKKKKLQKRKTQRKVAKSCSTTSGSEITTKQCWKNESKKTSDNQHHDTVRGWEQQELRLQAEYKTATENIRNCLRAEQRAKAETETWRAVLERISRDHRQKLFRHAYVLRTKLRRAENLLSFYEVRARNVQTTNGKLKSLIDKMKTDTKAIRDESERRRLNTKNNLDNKVGNLLKELERLKIKFNNVSPSYQSQEHRFSIATTAGILPYNSASKKSIQKIKPAPFVTAYSRHCNLRALHPKHDRKTYTSDVPRYPKLRTQHMDLYEPTKPERLSQKAVFIATRLSSDVSCLSVSPFPRIESDFSHKTNATSESELINLRSDVGKTSSPSSGFSGNSFSFRQTHEDASSVSPNYVTLVNDRKDVTSLYETRKQNSSNRRTNKTHVTRSSGNHGDKTSRSLPCASKEKRTRILKTQPATYSIYRR